MGHQLVTKHDYSRSAIRSHMATRSVVRFNHCTARPSENNLVLTEVVIPRPTVAVPTVQELNALIVNFNSPELGFLALWLAQRARLNGYVRSYVNKGRVWEKMLERAPLLADTHRRTFGRRRIADPGLISLTRDAGIWSDLLGAGFGRANRLPGPFRNYWMNHFQEKVRHAVSREATRMPSDTNCVVAYCGFGLPAFRSQRGADAKRKVLNYPIAHHRQQRKMRDEECQLQPDFASTWTGFDHWAPGFEDQLDEEIASADGILVGSSYARDSFVAEGVPKEKLKVVSYGVDLATFQPATERVVREKFEVVYAGQLTQRKGISYLLRGYQQFERRDSRLTIIGSTVEGMTPFLPYRHLFRHLPHLTRPALANMFRQSDVFVFPTLVEGMPLVVLEAMASGVPVIVTANGPADLVRDGVDGFIVPQRDPDAIADRLDRLYRNPELRLAMAGNARQRANEFGWDRYALQTHDYLSQLINA